MSDWVSQLLPEGKERVEVKVPSTTQTYSSKVYEYFSLLKAFDLQIGDLTNNPKLEYVHKCIMEQTSPEKNFEQVLDELRIIVGMEKSYKDIYNYFYMKESVKLLQERIKNMEKL